MSTHIDDFIDNSFGKDTYARWVLFHFRLPAALRADFDEHMKDHKLFCDWGGKRMRCTGGSRLGDVWLTADHAQERGYQHRVCVDECSNWGAKPT